MSFNLILNQFNRVYIPKTCFPKINFSIIFPRTPLSITLSAFMKVPYQNIVCGSYFPFLYSNDSIAEIIAFHIINPSVFPFLLPCLFRDSNKI